MFIIGQKNNLDIIDRWKTLPQFLIIQGDRHTGRTYLILYLCKKFKLTYHLMSNSVSDVRELLSKMKPNSNMIYHFKNFEEASNEAKNALLKITEEPIPGNYIIITGGPQIKTLESRAKRILMEPYTQQDMEHYINSLDEIKTEEIIDIEASNEKEQEIDLGALYNDDSDEVVAPVKKEVEEEIVFTPETIDIIFKSGINTPAKFNYYSKYSRLVRICKYAQNVTDFITYVTPEDFIMMLKCFDDRIEYGQVDTLLLFLNVLISNIEYKMKEKRQTSYKYILNTLIENKRLLIRQPTCKRKLLLFKLMYEIYIERNTLNEDFKSIKGRNS